MTSINTIDFRDFLINKLRKDVGTSDGYANAIDRIYRYISQNSLGIDMYSSTGLDVIEQKLKSDSAWKSAFKTLYGKDKRAITQFRQFLQYSQGLAQGVTIAKPSTQPALPRQLIYFGTPGSGKSYKVKTLIEKVADDRVFRTTFHPDSDYASFVGCYKPKMKDENITYQFVPQAFTKAYVRAWELWCEAQNAEAPKETSELTPVYLVIEEINRGNCAQIFGDLFQLLDRDSNGYSEYPITPDTDQVDYLQSKFKHKQNIEGFKGLSLEGKICLPPNLYILATMNTSDQSLFPMDSAFKRRWDWEYVPIDYSENVDSGKFEISIGDKENKKTYRWVDFLKAVNQKILEVTASEDKQMGNFFIKGDIDEEKFKSKVMFYLWQEVCKDEYRTPNNFFRCKDENKEFTFNALFGGDGVSFLQGFMAFLGVNEISNGSGNTNNQEGSQAEGEKQDSPLKTDQQTNEEAAAAQDNNASIGATVASSSADANP